MRRRLAIYSLVLVQGSLSNQFGDGILARLQKRPGNAQEFVSPCPARAVFVDNQGGVVGHLPVERGTGLQVEQLRNRVWYFSRIVGQHRRCHDRQYAFVEWFCKKRMREEG